MANRLLDPLDACTSLPQTSNPSTIGTERCRTLPTPVSFPLNPHTTSVSTTLSIPITQQPISSTPSSVSSVTNPLTSLISPSVHISSASVSGISPIQPASLLQTATSVHHCSASGLNLRAGSALSRLFQPYVNIRSQRSRQRLGPIPWEHDFYCIASPTANTLPTPEENTILKLNGLGRKKIRFEDINGSHTDFKKKIGEVFPSLQQAGAFKIMRIN